MQGALSAEGVETFVAQLERDRAAGQTLGAQGGGTAVAQIEQAGAQGSVVCDVACEGDLVAELFGRGMPDAHRLFAAAQCELLESRGAAGQGGAEQGGRGVLEGTDRDDADGAQMTSRDRADAGQLLHGKGAQPPVDVAFAERRDAARLVQVGGQLGEQLGGTDADRAGDGARRSA